MVIAPKTMLTADFVAIISSFLLLYFLAVMAIFQHQNRFLLKWILSLLYAKTQRVKLPDQMELMELIVKSGGNGVCGKYGNGTLFQYSVSDRDTAISMFAR